MNLIPQSDDTLVVRTDYTSPLKWKKLCALIEEPAGEFRASVEFVEDPELDGLDEADLIELLPESFKDTFIIMADSETFSDPEMPLLIVDLRQEVGRTFRALPSEIQAIENNLSIANRDFAEFADATDDDGVFRGFSD